MVLSPIPPHAVIFYVPGAKFLRQGWFQWISAVRSAIVVAGRVIVSDYGHGLAGSKGRSHPYVQTMQSILCIRGGGSDYVPLQNYK